MRMQGHCFRSCHPRPRRESDVYLERLRIYPLTKVSIQTTRPPFALLSRDVEGQDRDPVIPLARSSCCGRVKSVSLGIRGLSLVEFLTRWSSSSASRRLYSYFTRTSSRSSRGPIPRRPSLALSLVLPAPSCHVRLTRSYHRRGSLPTRARASLRSHQKLARSPLPPRVLEPA